MKPLFHWVRGRPRLYQALMAALYRLPWLRARIREWVDRRSAPPPSSTQAPEALTPRQRQLIAAGQRPGLGATDPSQQGRPQLALALPLASLADITPHQAQLVEALARHYAVTLLVSQEAGDDRPPGVGEQRIMSIRSGMESLSSDTITMVWLDESVFSGELLQLLAVMPATVVLDHPAVVRQYPQVPLNPLHPQAPVPDVYQALFLSGGFNALRQAQRQGLGATLDSHPPLEPIHQWARCCLLTARARALLPTGHPAQCWGDAPDPMVLANGDDPFFTNLHDPLTAVERDYHCLYLDVSASVRHDPRAGISRVVRGLLLQLLDAPPPGYRIEPVFEYGGAYYHARQYTLALLGTPVQTGDYWADSPIEPHSGALFLGVDWAPARVNAAEGALDRLRGQGVRIWFLVHDLLPVRLPQFFPRGASRECERWLAQIARQADGLACVSETVADDLRHWLAEQQIPEPERPRVGAIHLGADLRNSSPTSGLPEGQQQLMQALAQRPFMLMVGTIEPRKGHDQALAAMEQLWAQGVDAGLVIVGRMGWMRQGLARRLRNHPEQKVKTNARRLFWLEGASDEALELLYQRSSGLLFASEGEGYGLPLVEAAQCGLPILARDIPIFREVGGDHILYFQGDRPEDLAAAIRNWLERYREGTLPDPCGIQLPTWRESAQALLALVQVGQR